MSDPYVPGQYRDRDERILTQAKEAARLEAEQRLAGLRRRVDWDVRGIIAAFSIVAAFVIAGIQLIVTGDANIPAWAATLVGGITGFYFGSRGGGPGPPGGRRSTDLSVEVTSTDV